MTQQPLLKPQTQGDRIEAMLIEVLTLLKSNPAIKKVNRVTKITPYPDAFEDLWHEYPYRAGNNPKLAAFVAYNKRISESNSPEGERKLIEAGVQRYAAFCKATDKVGTEFVKQMASFLGPERHYNNLFEIPRKAETAPADDNELVKFATDRGMRDAHIGETFREYRAYVERVLKS